MGEKKEEYHIDLLPIRRLQSTDNTKGFISLLSQLSTCGDISDEQFQAQFSLLVSRGDDHVIVVIEDERTGTIVATGSVFVERKFIHGCGKVGHIEDVVVDSRVRGKKLGQKVVEYLAEHAKKVGCYKVILDCTAEMRRFYQKCGFVEKNVQMAMYF